MKFEVKNYNLGQNKMRNRSTPSPQFNDVLALQRKRAIFAIIEMGGGVVLIFHPFCPRLSVRVQRDRANGPIIKSSFFNTFIVI